MVEVRRRRIDESERLSWGHLHGRGGCAQRELLGIGESTAWEATGWLQNRYRMRIPQGSFHRSILEDLEVGYGTPRS